MESIACLSQYQKPKCNDLLMGKYAFFTKMSFSAIFNTPRAHREKDLNNFI